MIPKDFNCAYPECEVRHQTGTDLDKYDVHADEVALT